MHPPGRVLHPVIPVDGRPCDFAGPAAAGVRSRLAADLADLSGQRPGILWRHGCIPFRLVASIEQDQYPFVRFGLMRSTSHLIPT